MGNFTADDDPFQEKVTIGIFCYINDSLWRDQVDDETPFNSKCLDLKVMIGDNNAIEKICYEKAIPFAGVWHNYRDCIDTDGETASKLSDIGRALFHQCATYEDALKYIGSEHYKRIIKAMSSNKEFLEEIKRTKSLGFYSAPAIAGGLPPPPPPPAIADDVESDAVREAGDEKSGGSQNSISSPEAGSTKGMGPDKKAAAAYRAALNAGRSEEEAQEAAMQSRSSARRRRDDDDDLDMDVEEDDDDGGSMIRYRRRGNKRSHDDDDDESSARRRRFKPSKITRKVKSLFESYLQQQPKPQHNKHGGDAHQSLHAQYTRFVKESKEADPNADHSLAAWALLSTELVDNQLLANAIKLKAKKSKEYSLSAIESFAVEKNAWDNSDDMQSLMDVDGSAIRWVPSGVAGDYSEPIQVYLDPQFSVIGDVHQGSAALTLSSLHTTLFRLSDDTYSQLEQNKGVAFLDRVGVKDTDMTVLHGHKRLAALQHSINTSVVFHAVVEAMSRLGKASDIRLLKQSGDKTKEFSKDQMELIANLRSHINASIPLFGAANNKQKEAFTKQLLSVSETTTVAPLQLPLEHGIHAAEKVARLFYHHPKDGGSDKELVKTLRPLIDYLANPLAHLPGALSEGSSSSEEDEEEQSSAHGMRGRRVSPLLRNNVAAAKARNVAIADSSLELDADDKRELAEVVRRTCKESQDALAKMESDYQQHVGAAPVRPGMPPPFLAVSSAFSPFSADNEDDVGELLTLYKHYRLKGLTGTEAVSLLQSVLTVAYLIYTQKSKRFNEVDPSLLYSNFILEQYKIPYTKAILKDELDKLEKDKAALIASGSQVIFDKNGNSQVKSLLDHSQQTRNRQYTFSHNIGNKQFIAHVALLREQGSGSSRLAAVAGSVLALINTPAGQDSIARNAAVVEAVTIVANETAGVAANDLDFAAARDIFSTVASVISDHTALGVAEVLLLKSAGAAGPAFAGDLRALAESQGVSVAIVNQVQVWGNHDASHYVRATNRIPVGSMQGELFAIQLVQTSLNDCRLHHLMVKHNIEPLVCYMLWWPYIQMIGAHAAMVKDKAVGSVPFITPDCLLSEDGRQKMVYYHMSMYFKAMIKNYRALTHAHFVYCKRYEQGWGRSFWDPLNKNHTAQMHQHQTQEHSIFVIPTLVNRPVRAKFMSSTGEFGSNINVIAEERLTTRYEVMHEMRRVWHWTTDAPNSFDPRVSQRADAQYDNPSSNTLLCQGHRPQNIHYYASHV
jgi:hypothetical protein